MSRISWHDAFPDHPDRRSVAWATIETDDSLWDVPVEPSDFPTRPADAELLPAVVPHKHGDGHWCSADASRCAVDPVRRSFYCYDCQMAEMAADDERAARGSGFRSSK